MTFREALYNIATEVTAGRPYREDLWNVARTAVKEEQNDTVEQTKEGFLYNKLAYAASFGCFSIGFRCPAKFDQTGVEITEEDMKKFAEEHNLDFETETIAGTAWQRISFQKK